MRITVTNIRSQLNKASMLAWLRARPENERYAPHSGCHCMYHDMLMDVLDNPTGVYPCFDGIVVYVDDGYDERKYVPIGERGFASRFQRAACDYLDDELFNDGRAYHARPKRYGYATITRDEARAIAASL